MIGGYRAYARHRGCSLFAVQKAIAAGRIKADEKEKLIDFEAADLAWALQTDPAKQREEPPPAPPEVLTLLDGVVQAAPAALGRRPEWEVPFGPIEPRPAAAQVANVVDLGLYQRSRAEREHAEAEMAKDALALSRGKLIDRVDAERAYTAIGRMFAAARETLPSQLGPMLAGKTDPREIERIIRDEFRDADRRICDEIQAQFADVVRDGTVGASTGS